MGLQAWYPLINDMHNQGVGDTDLVVETTPAFGAGKIGNALISGGNSHWTAAQSEKVLNNNAISICFWVYVDAPEGDTNKRAMFFGNNNKRNYALFQYPSCNDFHWSWYSYDSSSTGTVITGGVLSGALPSYEWTHVAITYSNPNGAIYINGEKKRIFSGVMNNYTFSNQTPVIYQCQYRKLNDFRIYDHALSPREVKEISKGLVLHYPLAMPGQENLLQGSRMNKDTTKNWEWYGVNNTINRKFDNDAYYFETNDTGTVNNSYCMRVDRNAIGVQVGDTLTVSMDIRGTIAGESYLQIMSTTPSSTNFWAYSTRGTNPCSFGNTIKEDVFQRYSLTFTLPESHSTNTYFYIFPSIGFNSHIWYRNVKLERGSIATPWMPKIIGQDNLFDFEPIASNWAAESCTVANYFDSKWGNALQMTTTQANQRIYRNVSNVWEADTVYTVSFLAKASTPIQCNMSRSIADFSPTFNLNTEWRRYTGIINCTQTNSGGTLSFRLLTAGTVYITNITLEKGDTTSAYDGFDNTEYDVSGFGYNGIKFGILTYSSDTPIYNTSTIFNGTNNCIKFPFNDFCTNGDIFTMNIWWKKTELGTKNYETLIGGPGGFEMDTRSGAAQALSLYMTSTRGGALYSPFNMNEWYMITLVNDGTNELYYVNGVLVNTIAKKNMPSGNYYVGAWSNETGQNFKGFMSDFRFYKTALSADDILELYHTPISLSNNGTLLTQGEYVES